MDDNAVQPNQPVPAQSPVPLEVPTPAPTPVEPVPTPTPAAPDVTAPAPVQSNPLDMIFDQMVSKIIEQQEAIIGPIAVDQARLVKELKINWANKHEVDISGSPQHAIDDLVEQYRDLFGQIAVETCREAVAKLLVQVPDDQQPASLK